MKLFAHNQNQDQNLYFQQIYMFHYCQFQFSKIAWSDILD